MKKLLSIVLAMVLMLSMSVSALAADYGDLAWTYPLDSSYTDYYRGYSSGHLAIDLDAPTGADIYSVDSGAVKFSGYHSSTGYYVVIANDTRSSGISNPLYVRYLHMDNPPEVESNVDVSSGELVGYVGSAGAFIGNNRVPHLHMDINTIKATGGGKFTMSNTIDPMLFFPDVTFNRVNTRLPIFVDAPEGPFNPNEYIDTYLIRYVGEDRFDQWVKSTSGKVNIDSFKAQFNISEQQFQSLLSVYGISNIYA